MDETKIKYVVDVAPIVRLPLSRQQFFSYAFDRKVSVGSLVTVPLFNREIEGVVLACRQDCETERAYKLKQLSKILQENFLTSGQILLAQQLSNHYLTSLGVVLKHFLPKRVQSRIKIQKPRIKNQKIKGNIKLTKEQQTAVDEITKKHDQKLEIRNSKFLLFGPASSGKTEIYIHSILKLKAQDAAAQFLILLPELTLAPQAIERYGEYFAAEEIVVLHSKLGKGEFFANWEAVRSGQAKIIIATRIGIFAPFLNLGLVVIDEEQDMSFKQWDMNPRYDARLGAEFLAENHQCPVVFGTATPRIESMQKTLTGNFKLLEIPLLPAEIMGRTKTTPAIEVVDMRKEKWTSYDGKKKPNDSLLSLKLQGEIAYALSHKLQIILFVNHQGASTFSVCKNCKTVLKCPKCDRALVENETGIYKCLHCNFDAGKVPVCKSCKGAIFENIGIGTQGVAKEIKKLFPNARGARLDSATIKKPGMQEIIYRQFSKGQIDILVGTQMITKGWDNPKVGLVGIIDADSLFSAPDYLTDERAFSNIMQIAGRTGRVGSEYPGEVIIQTFNPQNPIFQFAVDRNYESFFEKEIKQRQALHYPPFGSIVRITFQEADVTKLEKEMQKIYTLLSDAISNCENLRLTAPSKPLVSKIRGKFRLHMLLRNFAPSASLPSPVIKIISELSTGWSVDVDPISIA